MTRQDIERLARECAHLRAFDGGFFPKEDEIAEDYEVCLQLLLSDHCIVPKSEVKELYDYAEAMAKYGQYDCMRERGTGQVHLLCTLFGTDLFKERSEE